MSKPQECTTHHFACACRERLFDGLKAENERLKILADNLKQLVRESLDYRNGIYKWNERARLAVAEKEEE